MSSTHAMEPPPINRSEEHTSELQSPCNLVCRLLLEKKKNKIAFFNDKINESQKETLSGIGFKVLLNVYKSNHKKGPVVSCQCSAYFFFNDTATTEIYTLSLHDALPISALNDLQQTTSPPPGQVASQDDPLRSEEHTSELQSPCNLVCRLLLEKKHTPNHSAQEMQKKDNHEYPIIYQRQT